MTTKTKPRSRLTAKQEAFCVNYVISRNATQAALKAGYSPKTAEVIGWENLGKPLIIARRNELEERIAAIKMMPEKERREALATIARETHFQPVTAGDRIRAIDTLNKLDKLYSPDTPPQNINILFVVGKGYRELPQLVEGEK